jgi:predicted ATPase
VIDRLKGYLRDQQLLLVLDNFEQVLAAAPQLADLLAVAPRLKLLITSRVTLHLSAEHRFPVPPLALPNLNRLATGGKVSEADTRGNLQSGTLTSAASVTPLSLVKPFVLRPKTLQARHPCNRPHV